MRATENIHLANGTEFYFEFRGPFVESIRRAIATLAQAALAEVDWGKPGAMVCRRQAMIVARQPIAAHLCQGYGGLCLASPDHGTRRLSR